MIDFIVVLPRIGVFLHTHTKRIRRTIMKYLPRYIACAALACSPVLALAQVYDTNTMQMQQPQAQAPVVEQYQRADTGQQPADLTPAQNQASSNGIAQMDYRQNAQTPLTRAQVNQDLVQAEKSGWLDNLNKTVYEGR